MSLQKLFLLVLSFIITMVGFAIYNGAAAEMTAAYEALAERNLEFVPKAIGGAFATAIFGLLLGVKPS